MYIDIELLWGCLYVYWDLTDSNGIPSSWIIIIARVFNIWSQIKFTVYRPKGLTEPTGDMVTLTADQARAVRACVAQ